MVDRGWGGWLAFCWHVSACVPLGRGLGPRGGADVVIVEEEWETGAEARVVGYASCADVLYET